LRACLDELTDREPDLKASALIRLAVVERRAGRLHDSVRYLEAAEKFIHTVGPSAAGRYHGESATTLKELGLAEGRSDYLERAVVSYQASLDCFKLLNNRRFVAVTENNHGFLLLSLNRFDEAETHLICARKLFEEFSDELKRAQVDETLSRLYQASDRYELAQLSIAQSVNTLENSGEDGLLAEALTTQGLILCQLGKRYEAKAI